jgi:hypothetical protein
VIAYLGFRKAHARGRGHRLRHRQAVVRSPGVQLVGWQPQGGCCSHPLGGEADMLA